MTGHFGFSYVGAVYLLLLFIPNLLWTRFQPEGYDPGTENRLLHFFERAGQVLTVTAVLIFDDYHLKPWSVWSLWLAASFALMIFYEIWWVRYFRGSKSQADFYSSLLGIPVAGATLPVASFLLLAVYGKVIWLFLASIVLGIGHIGIHLQHRKRLTIDKYSMKV